MPDSRAFSVLCAGIVLAAIATLFGCAVRAPTSTTIAPEADAAERWKGTVGLWFLEAPRIEVRDERGVHRRALVPHGCTATAEGPRWRQAAGDGSVLMREIADRPSGVRVVERATARHAECGAAVFGRTVEVIELPAGLELVMQLPMQPPVFGQSLEAGAEARERRPEWSVHGTLVGPLWGQDHYELVLGRDEATEVVLRLPPS